MASHPFYPPDLQVIGYVANTLSVPALLGSFALATLAVIVVTSLILKSFRPTISRLDKILVGWFIFTGCIHLFLEGDFVYNHRSMPGRTDLFGQLWKEYAKADSRYMTMEPFVLGMETITAFAWGPLSYLIAWLIVVQSPHRHPVQMLVSMGQVYGDVLYYATSMLDESYHALSYSRPEAYYYWGYFIFLNAFWIVIPGVCMYQSYSAMQRFAIQFETAGLYIIGTPTAQMHITFDELLDSLGGIVGLLEYGLGWRVCHSLVHRIIRYRQWNVLKASQALWIESSSPLFYELRHASESIRVTPAELEGSRFGRIIKEEWDGGMHVRQKRWIARMIVAAALAGMFKNISSFFHSRRLATRQ
ncbi:hypothetical protein ASPZODRAFT_28189 [Penicilliopsis zonata CBS 506.65]|uniref:EXPERA domain-containing protein n=1 Tax=Penicilliopsis zonata CBS 506.65 TaxID=1073090 RepID=A0A1L9S8N7_9EURO|nr:hypothetical protein ASPZODRAFT_28189 [Penicilliopsis zonata CBS 506.65]OJJ43521.1 hypothetical protein ASPZODRAFT_28189 [Penicilliopsis zonata CBS 506.65]